MKRNLAISAVAFTLLGASACASNAATIESPNPAAAPAQVISLPAPAGAGKEVKVLAERPGLKLAMISLPTGTILPKHSAPMDVTIVALEGAGTVIANGERLRIDGSNLVVLAAEVEHVVEPDEGTDLIVLVHHMGTKHGAKR